MTTVTKEMIGAAHDVMLAKGDFVLSANLLERIYVAMEQAAPPPQTPFGWCGTSFTGTKKFTFLDAPKTEALLCARCEEKAVKAGLPSAYALTGHHVHIGRVSYRSSCTAANQQQPGYGNQLIHFGQASISINRSALSRSATSASP